MSRETFLAALQPILDHLNGLELSDADATRQSLTRSFPLESPGIQRVRSLFREGVEQGWLCDKAAGTARFSRVAKGTGGTHDFSIDAVRLDGPGMWHRHTGGEIDLCFAAGEGARFDGHPEGWVVFGAGSDHVPTVTGGPMDILYFLPGGAIEWKP